MAKIYRYPLAGLNSFGELKVPRCSHEIIFEAEEAVMRGDGKKASEMMWKHVLAAKEVGIGILWKEPELLKNP